MNIERKRIEIFFDENVIIWKELQKLYFYICINVIQEVNG